MKTKMIAILIVLILLLGGAVAAFAQSGNIYLPLISSVNAAVTSTAYSQSGGVVTKSSQAYAASEADQSAVYVTNSGVFTLADSTIVKSGNTSSNDSSSFYGLNAAVLAEAGSAINLANSAINSNGSGANGAFSTGSGSVVNLSNVTIEANGGGAHGVMATQGGIMTLTNVDINTTGANSAPIATDRGSGTITVNGSESTASGQDSPCLYSTGILTISNATCTATGSESAVIEGANTIILTDSTLVSSKADKWGVMIYQSMSGDAEGKKGVFTMSGGALANTATTGPLFYVTNSTGIITLNNVDITAGSGILIAAEGNDRWGTSGSNGGTVSFTANGQTLIGNIVVDAISSLTASLQNTSSLTGAINTDHTAKTVNLVLDASSTWIVTANSYLTCLNDSAGISGSTLTNVTGNGYTVYYNATACSALGGLTYTLNGGGTLQPATK